MKEKSMMKGIKKHEWKLVVCYRINGIMDK